MVPRRSQYGEVTRRNDSTAVKCSGRVWHAAGIPAARRALLRRFVELSICLGGSVAEWLACWTQAQKGPGSSNRSRDAVG